MNKIPYVRLAVGLHSCVNDLDELMKDMRAWLMDRLDPEYRSDIKIELIESAGLNDEQY